MSGRKGNDSKLSSYFTVPPQSRLRLDSSPASGGAFWCSANSYVKPALKGEVANEVSRRGCKEAYLLFVWFTPSVSPTARQLPRSEPEGLKSSSFLFACRNPSVKPSVCQLPGRGAFWCAIQAQTITPRSGISHCESNISLRVSAISPCVSRISSRVSALPPTSSCYSRGSGCGTRAAARWAVSA